MRLLAPELVSRVARSIVGVLLALFVTGVTGVDAGTPPPVPVPCLSCPFDPPTVIITTPGAILQLTGDTVAGDYLTAHSCGDIACLYDGAAFGGIGEPFTVAGDCGQYSGFGGGPTRPSSGTPGKCVVEFNPSSPLLIWPGGYYQIDYVQSVGSFVTGGKTFLIGIEAEIFNLTVTALDPVSSERPASAFAVKVGADPVRTDCVTDVVTGYLPNRIAPDCVALPFYDNPALTGFFNPLPDGDWDILAFKSAEPLGKLRSAVTPWKPTRVTMAGVDQQAQVVRTQNPQLAITAELLGGDDKLSVDEDGTVHVTVSASSVGVEGAITSINFINAKPIFQEGPGGGGKVTVSTASPPPPYGFSLAAGESRSFDVPVRGVTAGPVNLHAKTFGFTPFNEDRNANQVIAIQVTSDPPPPPERPTEVCGYDVLTYVASASTGTTLAVESVAGIGVGTELIVDPCTSNAEQVTVSALDGKSLTVGPAMLKAHAKDAAVIRRSSNGTILAAASAIGATELAVLRNDRFALGDAIVIEPGTNREESATVTGFGSIVVDHPLQFAHGIGVAVVRVVPCGDVPLAKVQLAKLLAPTGDDKLTLQATFSVIGAVLDPVTSGARLVLQDDLGGTVADVGIPAGAYQKATKTGWKSNKKLTSFTYAPKGGPKAGLKLDGKGNGTFKLTVDAATLTAPAHPVATVTLGDFCAEAEFASAGHGCVLKSKGKTLTCKAAPSK